MLNLTVALLGNPNCGKSTLFNALTGSQQQIGNWPGVTVERKSGFFTEQGTQVEVIDLPGTYSLTTAKVDQAVDTHIACEYLLSHKPDLVINVIDATHLERQLYLSLQLLEMGIPVIIALSMMDIAKKQNILIDIQALAKQLGCPVIPLQPRKKQGLAELKQAILIGAAKPARLRLYPPALEQAIDKLASLLTISKPARVSQQALAVHLLENDHLVQQLATKDQLAIAAEQQRMLEAELGEELDIIFADARYGFIQQLVDNACQKKNASIHPLTTLLDKVVLNRFLGIPIFLAVIYVMFFFAINVGGAFQAFFDMSSMTLFVEGPRHLLSHWHFPVWLIAIIADGAGKGLNTTITFIPVIAAMFLFLAVLESSGYMARAAFVMDRVMRTLGLPGKSFVPMIIGFGCNVPAVMAARTLENKRDRILTIMMTPFMSCSARMAIYAIFVAAFFPKQGHNVVFALYLLGIGMAGLTGLLLRKTLLRGKVAPLILELPPYHLPSAGLIIRQMWQRLTGFIMRAGKLIVPFCMLLGVLNAINLDGTLNFSEGNPHSLLAVLGKGLTPLFMPIGIHMDNWPATVGLLAGILAKEVVVGSLNALYSQMGHLTTHALQPFDLWQGLKEAWLSIPANLLELGQALRNPLLATMPEHNVQPGVYGEMYARFGSASSAFSYLLFVLLYLPCISTVAVIARELSRGWAMFATLWSTLLAYSVALLFYQIATFNQHVISSCAWIFTMSSIVIGFILGLSAYSKRALSHRIPDDVSS